LKIDFIVKEDVKRLINSKINIIKDEKYNDVIDGS